MHILYVDGAALDESIKQTKDSLGIGAEEFDYARFFGQFGGQRVFYYDSLPNPKPEEEPSLFAKRFADKEVLFAALGRLDGVHVRNGTTKWKKRRGEYQKAVDVLLAVDAVSHALTSVSTMASLLLNDLDFYPILETLRNSRVTTRLIYDSTRISQDLIEISDRSEPLWMSTVLKGFLEPIQNIYLPSATHEGGPLMPEERAKAKISSYYGQEIAVWSDERFGYVAFLNGQRMAGKTEELAFSGILAPSSLSQTAFLNLKLA